MIDAFATAAGFFQLNNLPSKQATQVEEIDLSKKPSVQSNTTNPDNDSEYTRLDSVLETQEDLDFYQQLFGDFDQDHEEFYDFTNAMKVPDTTMTF